MTTSFRNGRKYTDGVEVRALHSEVFPSNSNPNAQYIATFWQDGDVSCNCRGWATHKHCRHCEELVERAEQGRLRAAPIVNDAARSARLRWVEQQRFLDLVRRREETRERDHFDRTIGQQPTRPPLPLRRRVTPAPDQRPQRPQPRRTPPRDDPPPPPTTGRKIAL